MKVQPFYRSPVALAAALAIATTACPAFAQTATKDSSNTTSSQSATNNAEKSGASNAAHSGANSAAQSADKAAAKSQLSALDREAMKVSEDGFNAMRSVRAARIAIFNGEPKLAHEMVSKADSSLKAATKDEKTLESNASHAGSTNSNSNSKDNTSGAASSSGNNGSSAQTANEISYVPIDGGITLVDSFVDSPAKKAHIDKANEHIAKGDSKGAMDELKLADVGASITRVLMPLQATTKHVDEASKLMGQQKYYQANLALKAAEDGLIVESVAMNGTPKANSPDASNSHKSSTNQNSTNEDSKSSKPQS